MIRAVFDLSRFRLAVLLWRATDALMPFVEATLLGRRSLPRIVLGRLVLRLVWGLTLAGKRLAPEIVESEERVALAPAAPRR